MSKSIAQQNRQRARRKGKYVAMPECPRCGKRRNLEPAYEVREDSKWSGLFICPKCIKEES